MRTYTNLLIILFTIAFVGCKKPYSPEVTSVNSNLLVVEGTINTGADSTIFKLSRTVLVSSKVTAKPEPGAVLTVESNANESYVLTARGNGTYFHPGLNVSPAKKYRLRIRTSAGAIYLSDYVESKVSPAIDSVSWKADDSGLQLYTTTHDAGNNSKYYRWEYQETWKFAARYRSEFYFANNDILSRTSANDIYQCWAGSASSTIVLASSAKLSQDVISENPLTKIAFDSEKVSIRYSILVKQYVLTREAFDFWSALKKNTESLGSIFDAQPSELTGNIHNIANPDEPVIGYVAAGSTTSQRIFIGASQLPNWRVKYPATCFEPDTVLLVNPRTGIKAVDLFKDLNNIVVSPTYNVIGNLTGYTRAGRDCADCTVRGTTKQPAFWQ